ncbi:MAG TPA: MATE family efflux transporter [Hyphomicrobiaceae bacterium]|nr:MATE family efflux transporter [Hyphomicrobiaceae bacterium]
MRDTKPARDASSSAAAAASTTPRFVEGSLLKHVLVMSGTGAVGLMAIFLGDFANLLFLGMLGDTEIIAAVGYASTVLFFSVSLGIGLSIGAAAVVSPAVGARRTEDARRLSTSAHLLSVVVSAIVVALLWPWLATVLGWLGARGRTLELATTYSGIVLPSTPLLALGMCAGGVLRSVGDPRRAMYVTLGGAAINVLFDPILIFWAGFGMEGAAYASVLARITIAGIALWAVGRVHGMFGRPGLAALVGDTRRIMAVAVPAMMTNLATPTANAFTTSVMATYGDAAVAAWTIFGRVVPLAFGALFALSGSIGPIIGQNLGAGDFGRVRTAIREAVRVTAVFTLVAWGVLALAAPFIASGFGARGETEVLVLFACRWLAPLFAFLGGLFVANAIFNTLRHPHYATLFNWGRATIGTVPFVWLGGHLAGPHGVFVGNLVGAVVFGSIALVTCFRVVDRLEAAAKSTNG